MSAALITLFEGAELPSYVFRGRPCWIAAEAGVVAGYAEGRHFVDQIRGDWREDFRAGRDFELLRGQALKEFRGVSGESPESSSRFAGRLLVLYEPGILMGLLLAKTDRGRRLRRFIVDEVLPQLLRTGRVVLPGAPADPEVERLRAENERLRLDALAGIIGEARAFASVVGPLRELAMVGARSRRDVRSNRRLYENRLRNRVNHNGDGSDWPSLPRRKLEKAERLLRHWRKQAVAAARRQRLPVGTPTQISLPFDAGLAVRRAN